MDQGSGSPSTSTFADAGVPVGRGVGDDGGIPVVPVVPVVVLVAGGSEGGAADVGGEAGTVGGSVVPDGEPLHPASRAAQARPAATAGGRGFEARLQRIPGATTHGAGLCPAPRVGVVHGGRGGRRRSCTVGRMSSPLLVSLPDADLLEEVRGAGGERLEGVEWVVWDVATPVSDALPADQRERLVAVVLPYLGPKGAIDDLASLPALRLVQTQSTGYDSVLPHVPDGVALATAAGAHDAGTAEIAVALVLACVRRLDDAVRDAQSGRWDGPTDLRPGLAGRTVLVLGAGGIGNAVVRRLLPFEVDVVRVARSARTDDLGPVHGMDDLADLLPSADVVVLAVPLLESTRGLVDRGFLAAMPDGAVLVNVARGAVVDTGALLAEVGPGRLRAGLDVTDPEPLPPDHPLWSAPGVVVTPHVGGATDAMRPRVVALVRRQLDALLDGRDPENLVAREEQP